MSGVAIIRSLLVADAALTAQVPATKIMAGVMPINTVLPAISITDVSMVENSVIDAAAAFALVTSRVQVTVMTKTYLTAKALIKLARKACNYKRGTLAGYIVSSVRTELVGPDFNDSELDIYMQSIDFKITYHEPN